MPQSQKPEPFQWFCAGDDIFPAMIEAIRSAKRTVRLEVYIYSSDKLGEQFREALVNARQRGLTVRVMVDSFGSVSLASNFWDPLTAAGGEVHWFNPLLLKRFTIRDHRKVLVCDEQIAFVGGYNISHEYEGDGVKSGWRDLGLQINGSPAGQLAEAFDELFALADFQHKRFMRIRRSFSERQVPGDQCELLLAGPGRGPNPFTQTLHQDLKHARTDLMRVARTGGKVQLILPGKSDVILSQLACRSLYRRFLRAGVEIYEYQPQILHAKLIIVDDTVYVGSSNLDPRSLQINYELMLRFHHQGIVAGGRACYKTIMEYSTQITSEAWRKSRTWWSRLKQRWAYFLLARVDPNIARWQYKRMPN
jgi:cardiolipin synthase